MPIQWASEVCDPSLPRETPLTPKPTFREAAMNELNFEHVAELRVLARIVRKHDLGGQAFQRYSKLVHDDNGTELSALARIMIQTMPVDANPHQVARIINVLADDIEARWVDA
jgi:hypothetical protein